MFSDLLDGSDVMSIVMLFLTFIAAGAAFISPESPFMFHTVALDRLKSLSEAMYAPVHSFLPGLSLPMATIIGAVPYVLLTLLGIRLMLRFVPAVCAGATMLIGYAVSFDVSKLLYQELYTVLFDDKKYYTIVTIVLTAAALGGTVYYTVKAVREKKKFIGEYAYFTRKLSFVSALLFFFAMIAAIFVSVILPFLILFAVLSALGGSSYGDSESPGEIIRKKQMYAQAAGESKWYEPSTYKKY